MKIIISEKIDTIEYKHFFYASVFSVLSDKGKTIGYYYEDTPLGKHWFIFNIPMDKQKDFSDIKNTYETDTGFGCKTVTAAMKTIERMKEFKMF